MRSIIIFALAILVVGGFVARQAENIAPATVAPDAPKKRAGDKPRQGIDKVASGSRSLTLSSDRAGHFQVDANVDGGRINFVVDSGASQVVLRESDAAKIGIRPVERDYTATVSTANGQIRAARARLNRVAVGDITVHDVNALVLPDRALSTNLLGVSFLSRLKRYEYANGRLVLEQ